MSVMNVFIGPFFRIKDSNVGMATRYFVKSQISVTAYSFSRSALGNGPIVFTNTLSYALKGVYVIVKGVFVCFVVLAC